MKAAQKVFTRAIEVVGGKGALASIFQKQKAFTVETQAGVAADIAAGVPVSEILSTRNPVPECDASANEIRAAKHRLMEKLGGEGFKKFMKVNGRCSLEAQYPAILAALGETPKAKPATATPVAPPPPSRPTEKPPRPEITAAAKTASEGATAWYRYCQLQKQEPKNWAELCRFTKANHVAIENGRAQCLAEFEQALKKEKDGMGKLEIAGYIREIKSL